MPPRTFIQVKGLVEVGAMSMACLFLSTICGVGHFFKVGGRNDLSFWRGRQYVGAYAGANFSLGKCCRRGEPGDHGGTVSRWVNIFFLLRERKKELLLAYLFLEKSPYEEAANGTGGKGVGGRLAL